MKTKKALPEAVNNIAWFCTCTQSNGNPEVCIQQGCISREAAEKELDKAKAGEVKRSEMR